MMRPQEMADWVRARTCAYHSGKDPDYPCKNALACERNLAIAQCLEQLKPFKGTDDAGQSVQGYFMEWRLGN